MSRNGQIDIDQVKAEARDAARAYFEQRDKLTDDREALLDKIEILAKNRVPQEEIAETISFDHEADNAPDDWKFHRTRVQQFIKELRERGRLD